MKQIIQMTAGLPFQWLDAELAGAAVRIRLYWSNRFGLYNVDLYAGERPIALGRALHPEIDLLHGLNLGWGKLYLEGAAPTPENLGIANRLIHET